MKSIDRLYPPNHKCHDCNHDMRYHTRLGCNVRYCLCQIRNYTFTEYIRAITTKNDNFLSHSVLK